MSHASRAASKSPSPGTLQDSAKDGDYMHLYYVVLCTHTRGFKRQLRALSHRQVQNIHKTHAHVTQNAPCSAIVLQVPVAGQVLIGGSSPDSPHLLPSAIFGTGGFPLTTAWLLHAK
ncbi:hypothetical protein C8Q76DRAFT_697394 [Earliella scabrosa]|nr:hypothetical protein C8Q76DRAFT_697394 [Earliella scabrosa]